MKNHIVEALIKRIKPAKVKSKGNLLVLKPLTMVIEIFEGIVLMHDCQANQSSAKQYTIF
jgi:hypothetical protein